MISVLAQGQSLCTVRTLRRRPAVVRASIVPNEPEYCPGDTQPSCNAGRDASQSKKKEGESQYRTPSSFLVDSGIQEYIFVKTDSAPGTPSPLIRSARDHSQKPIGAAGSLTASKRPLFALFTLFFPLLILLMFEVTLRALRVGPNLALFVSETPATRGGTYRVMNPGFKSRYFSRVEFSPATSPDVFPMPKPVGTFRIFCLGGSTTVGYPYGFNGSFSSFLRTRLQRTFPDRKIETINLGMTATNSYTVVDIAREIVDCEPDLIIVYDGHNEFYGALGTASHESIGPSRLLTKLYLHLIHLRTFLLARDAIAVASRYFSRGPTEQGRGTIMERLALGRDVPYRSPIYNECLATFRANLREFIQMTTNRGIPVVLGSQVSNLRDQPPFVSAGNPDLPAKALHACSENFRLGQTLQARGQMDSALTAFRSSCILDSTRADVHFAIARCLDSLGRKMEAGTEYRLARDYDQLRFRASTDFNIAILHLDNGKDVLSVDLEPVFAAHSRDSLIGKDLVFEHVHPNSRGNFLIARAFAGVMRHHGFLTSRAEWTLRDTLDDARLWEDRKVTELDERIAQRRTEILTSGWPFRSGYPTLPSFNQHDTLAQIAERVTRGQWDWKRAHEAAIQYYAERRDRPSMEREYRVLIDQIPLDVHPYLELSKVYLEEGRSDELRRTLTASLEVQPTIQAYRALGDLALQDRKPMEAIALYEKTVALSETVGERAESKYLLALANLQANNPDRADAILTELLKENADFRPARVLLGRLRSSAVRKKR